MECCAFFSKTVDSSIRKIRSFLRLKDSESINKSYKWVARVCDVLVYVSIAYFTFCQLYYILPFQYETILNENSMMWKMFYVFVELVYFYVIYSCTFHYYKAKTVRPVSNPGRHSDYFCKSCQNRKGLLTFHCKACNKCIYLMDHHCPWIGQCVGAHNQAHFYLFLFHMFLITALLVIASHSYFYHFFNSIESEVQPFRDAGYCTFCGRVYLLVVFGTTMENRLMTILVAYFSMISIMMTLFLIVYTWRITWGKSHLLRKLTNRKGYPNLQMIVTRWRAYFSTQPDDYFLANFVFPRTRRPVQYGECRATTEEEDEKL